MQVTNRPELTVKIESLSNLGFGVAKSNGYVIFVESACPGDKVKIRLIKENKSFARAKILEIITPSPHRTEPFCPMQKICGACQLQFIDYDYQLLLKKEIVKDTIRSICGGDIEVRDVIKSPKDREYRHKIQYPVSETKNSKRILAGYYKQGSHELVNIKYCPIQPEYCDGIIEFIRESAKECGVSGYDEKNHRGELKHIVIRTSRLNKKSLVTLVVNSADISDNIRRLANAVFTKLPDTAGAAVNFNPAKTNLIFGENTQILEGQGFVEEELCGRIFKIGVKTFFQVNPYTAENIFRFVKNYISSNFEAPVILDAYAGIAAFGICLSDISKKAVCVEEVKESVLSAEETIRENGIKNIKLYNADAEKFFEQELNSNSKYDITILDPPRKGCSEKSLEYILKLTKSKIIYVSCNPASLARDLKYLIQKGCKADFIQPFDMFPHSYHIESAALITV